MAFLLKVFEVLKLVTPFVRNPDGTMTGSKRLLINIPIMIATVLLAPESQDALKVVLPTLWLVRATAAASLVTMFFDYWRKIAKS